MFPDAFFSFSAANNGFEQLRQGSGNRFGWEDLARSGDGDFDDLNFSVTFLPPPPPEEPITNLAITTDTGVQQNPSVAVKLILRLVDRRQGRGII